MKTFATNGTGSQQTLVELESEKIPVYEDLADAESDLANLAENQIIATHDTGSELSAPVDTVQSGNMHAVTSNAVAESLSYSTTEQATGGKWIDGKPIYRKVIDCGTLPNGTTKTIANAFSNVDTIIQIKGVAQSTGYTLPIPYNDIVANNGGLRVFILDKKDIELGTGTNFSAYTGILIVEYTKTTD